MRTVSNIEGFIRYERVTRFDWKGHYGFWNLNRFCNYSLENDFGHPVKGPLRISDVIDFSEAVQLIASQSLVLTSIQITYRKKLHSHW